MKSRITRTGTNPNRQVAEQVHATEGFHYDPPQKVLLTNGTETYIFSQNGDGNGGINYIALGGTIISEEKIERWL